MQDELEDNQENYFSLTHEDWCDLLSTIKFKDNRKKAATQTKRIATPKEASHSDSDGSIRFLLNKRYRTCVIPNRKQKGKNTPKHHSAQRYCVLFKKARMPEQKYMPHISEDCFGTRSEQQFIKDRL